MIMFNKRTHPSDSLATTEIRHPVTVFFVVLASYMEKSLFLSVFYRMPANINLFPFKTTMVEV